MPAPAMTPDPLSDLEELARKATGGEWEAVFANDPRGVPVPYYRGLVCTVEHSEKYTAVVAKSGYVDQAQWEPNAQFIAAANPQAVLGLIAEVRRLRGALTPLLDFFRYCIEEGSWNGGHFDGGALQDKAVALGLLAATKYDPAVHGEAGPEYAEPGDDWYVFSDTLNALESK